MTILRVATEVALPTARAQESLVIPQIRELVGKADQLLTHATQRADASGKMLRPDRYVRDVRGMVGEAADLVQQVESHATSLYGAPVGARQAGRAALSLGAIDQDLAAYAGKDRMFGDTRNMGLDAGVQQRIRAAGEQVGALRDWSHRLVVRPPMPSRPPLAAEPDHLFSAAPVGHAAQPAPHGMVAPPAAFSSPEELHAASVAPKRMKAPTPGFSSVETLDKPVKASRGIRQRPLAFSAAEQTDIPVKARRGARAAKLTFSNPTTTSKPPRQTARPAEAPKLLFQDGSQ